jgi:hypothetical protein
MDSSLSRSTGYPAGDADRTRSWGRIAVLDDHLSDAVQAPGERHRALDALRIRMPDRNDPSGVLADHHAHPPLTMIAHHMIFNEATQGP